MSVSSRIDADPLAAAKLEIAVIRYEVTHSPRTYLSDAVDRLGDVVVDLIVEVERLRAR